MQSLSGMLLRGNLPISMLTQWILCPKLRWLGCAWWCLVWGAGCLRDERKGETGEHRDMTSRLHCVFRFTSFIPKGQIYRLQKRSRPSGTHFPLSQTHGDPPPQRHEPRGIYGSPKNVENYRPATTVTHVCGVGTDNPAYFTNMDHYSPTTAMIHIF